MKRVSRTRFLRLCIYGVALHANKGQTWRKYSNICSSISRSIQNGSTPGTFYRNRCCGQHVVSLSSSSDSNKENQNGKKPRVSPSIRELTVSSECAASDSKWADTPFSKQVFTVLGLSEFSKEELEDAFRRADLDNNDLLEKEEFRSLVKNASNGKLSKCEVDNFTESFWKYHAPEVEAITKSQFLSRTEALAKELDPRVNALSLTFLLAGTSIGLIIPVMPQLAQSLAITSSQYGTIIGSFAFAKMIGNIPAATFVDKYGRKSSIVIGLGTIGVSMGAVGLADSYEWIMLCRFLSGLGVASFSAGAIQYLSDISTPLNRAKTIAPPMTAFSLGTALGPAAGGILLDYTGFVGTFALVGTGFIALAGANYIFLPKIVTTALETDRAGTGTSDLKEKDKGLLQTWKGLLLDRGISNMILVNGGYWFVLSGSQMTLLPLLLSGEKFGLSASAVGSIFMGMSMVGVVCTPIAGRLLDSVGRVRTIVPACMVIGSAMMSAPMVDDIYSFVALVCTWTAAGTLLGAGPTTYISDMTTSKNRAQALALLRTAGDIGMLLGALGAGTVADMFSQEQAIQANGIAFLALSGFAAIRFATIVKK